MKKFPIVLAVALLALTCAGCGKESEEGEAAECFGNAAESSVKSMVVFDEEEFTPDNAYATVYIGVIDGVIAPKAAKNWKDFYAYGFFAQEDTSAVTNDIYSHLEKADPPEEKVDGWNIFQYYESYRDMYEEMCAAPLEEMTSLSCVQNQVYMVHHETDVENYEKYVFSNREHNGKGKTATMEFGYSLRVKLPEEFFNEKEGDFCFYYRAWYSMEERNVYRYFNRVGGKEEVLNCHYKKKGDKIKLDKTVLLDKSNEDIKIANLEQA